MKIKMRLASCLTCLLLICTLALTSCSNSSGVVGARINDNGELILTYWNGAEQNLGVVVGGDGNDGSLVITGDGSSIPAATAKGLRSSVSIVCKFRTTVQQGGWRPGFGSTATQEYSSAGSGVIYQMDKGLGDAFIITNYHVVYDASSNTKNGISDDISVYLYGSFRQ